MKTFEREYILTTLTDLCSHGADPQKEEFRYPQLKQCMVFWWRALLGNPEGIREKEAKWFGDTSRSSPIKLSPVYSDKVEDDRRNIRFNMKCLCSEEEAEVYRSLLQIISFLGSMGKGCRKGQGAFYIHEPDITSGLQNIAGADEIPKMKGIPESERELQTWIAEAIENFEGRKVEMSKADGIQYSDERNKSKGAAKNNYARLQKIYVGKKMDIAALKSTASKSTGKPLTDVKEIKEFLKNHLDRSSVTILSAYPGDREGDHVYPVLSQFYSQF